MAFRSEETDDYEITEIKLLEYCFRDLVDGRGNCYQ